MLMLMLLLLMLILMLMLMLLLLTTTTKFLAPQGIESGPSRRAGLEDRDSNNFAMTIDSIIVTVNYQAKSIVIIKIQPSMCLD